nr:hypothetical protein [Tanacetum cinerariifolium]
RSWKLYNFPGVHVLELEDGTDPVGNTITTAVQLIKRIKGYLMEANRRSIRKKSVAKKRTTPHSSSIPFSTDDPDAAHTVDITFASDDSDKDDTPILLSLVYTYLDGMLFPLAWGPFILFSVMVEFKRPSLL